MTTSGDYQVFEAGDVPLQSDVVFPSMRLAYKTYGSLNARKDNVIVYPTSFSAQHLDTEWLIQPGGILDPERYLIIIPNLFGNGLSSSPSNSGITPFPAISYHDAVAVQRRLLVEQFGIAKIALVYGWSMGGMQAYHWAACHPDMVERAAIVCGSARCSPYNHVFLEGVKAALITDPNFRDGRFTAKPTAGLRAMGRIYAGWAMSHAFYRDEVWREGGFTSLEDYLTRSWDEAFARRDANDLLAQIGIWQRGDISRCAEFDGNIGRALAAIKARVLLMPGQTDRYFDVRDNEDEIGKLVNAKSAELHPIPSIHGHRAGNPINYPADRAFINAEISAFLKR
ncbi:MULTISPECIES: alpha/beta fold hydrolase [unclassified Bradyrhizobium]|uniref:alpha/beta fold hydrolase n=1 Tax=unclassified Bradyrhizobium TaxID=2631580 RepID=UPI001BADF070|nr:MULTISPECIES: alpha/beta fold hydrolase [unclassified Bradyrhizobium]MBR1223829.1 alpha/beta fold hydrolase [Bradyrhizobium sp. AUGA SZCCT0176]MBR1298256.1 alpha/beta fold hydrolase [Bradyrhizobium sp. AUGA SZCCT0042]